MKIRKPKSAVEWVLSAAGVYLVLMACTFVVGQVRGCWAPPTPKMTTPVAPPVIPGPIDAGAPAPGPVSQAPTDNAKIDIAVPRLSREEVLAAAARVGLKLAPTVRTDWGLAAAGQGAGATNGTGDRGTGVPGAESGSTAPPSASAVAGVDPGEGGNAAETVLVDPRGEYPYMLGEQRFTLGPAGDAITVQAWVLQAGERVTMRGKWDDYQAPTPPPQPVCAPSGGWLGVDARWEGMAGVGGVGTPDGFGPGGVLGVGYRGLHTGRLTWGVDGIAVPAMIDGKWTGLGIIAATTHLR